MTTPEVFSDPWMAQVAATLERISNRSSAKEAAAMTTPAAAHTPGHRVRIEVSTSVKGIHTYSATVERSDVIHGPDGEDITNEAVFQESAALVQRLDALYPKEV